MRPFFSFRGHAGGMPPEAPSRFEALARNLEALASPTRLEILHALRAPRALHEIRVAPTLTREGENEARALSRQAVTRHLDQLLDLGLVQRIPAPPRARGDSYALNHERLFAVIDEMRQLAKLRALLPDAASPRETLAHDEAGPLRLPESPRLVVAYGRDDGVGFGLGDGPRWRIGRGAGCEVPLDYDPYLSSENTMVERRAAGYTVADLGSRNGTWLNWARLPPHAPRELRPGDVLVVGRSTLVYQP